MCVSPSRCASFEYLVARRDIARVSFDAFDGSSTTVSRRRRRGKAIPVVSLYAFLLSSSCSVGRDSICSGRQAPDVPAKHALGTRYETRSGGKPAGTPIARRYVSQSKSASFCSLVSRGSSSLARRAPSGSPSRASPARGRAVGTRRGRAEVEAGVAVGETRLRGAEAVVSAAPAEVPARRFSAKGKEKSADRSACASRLSCRFLTSAHPTNRARREECSGLGRVAMRGRSASQGTCAAPRVGHASRSRASTDQHSSRVHSFKHLISQLWRKHSRKLEFLTSSQIKWLTG